MFYMFIMINILLSFIFMFLKHPLSMGLILLMQTILISLLSGMFAYSYWFSYILFLVMLGGMLVLFIYMTSLASNEIFHYSNKLFLFSMIFIMTLMMIFITIDYMNFIPLMKNSNMIELNNSIMFMKNEMLISLNKIYNNPNSMITMILINYLFLTLIAVVKITNMKSGPLRQKF
uniref:NADH-ubiquinone oxidoreductase chain 6 n=1 Tax=Dineutus mellyi TaxID=357803 RepID=A0A7S8HQ45_DINME|nr:NADH dehydrogenase subunit 6 [Dineutus mellyi]QPC56772.1 NADH dehydrogenase subunit 6 [Dineutus mellyi]